MRANKFFKPKILQKIWSSFPHFFKSNEFSPFFDVSNLSKNAIRLCRISSCETESNFPPSAAAGPFWTIFGRFDGGGIGGAGIAVEPDGGIDDEEEEADDVDGWSFLVPEETKFQETMDYVSKIHTCLTIYFAV